MDIQPQNQQPISDDQELAKVLAGVTQQADEPQAPIAPLPEPPAPVEPPVLSLPTELSSPELTDQSEPVMPAFDMPASSHASISGDSSLDAIKQDAITELRPLIDKLDVSPEEKFDTYLLLLRSTDDQALVGPAHEAARLISDEARRAQALLDIIKEIDFFSNKTQ